MQDCTWSYISWLGVAVFGVTTLIRLHFALHRVRTELRCGVRKAPGSRHNITLPFKVVIQSFIRMQRMQTAGVCANPVATSLRVYSQQATRRGQRCLTQAGLFGLGAPSKTDISTKKQQVRFCLIAMLLAFLLLLSNAQLLNVLASPEVHKGNPLLPA